MPFRRMECDPGEEAQVDFGSGAWIVKDGKKRRAHVLRVILSHSRKGYSEAVFKQSTENFIRVLENAFHAFGGIPQTLVIDDMGIKKLPKQSGEYLFEIIMRRHELRSTVMTSNRPLEEWGKLIGDVPTAAAILDRILHKAEIIQITGRSCRLKNRANKQKREEKKNV